MDGTIAEAWALALESGEYTQGMGVLRTEGAFCCLGVLCDLHLKRTGAGSWDRDDHSVLGYKVAQRVDVGLPPYEVMAWLGINDSNISQSPGEAFVSSIVAENDNGSPFRYIATMIRDEVARRYP